MAHTYSAPQMWTANVAHSSPFSCLIILRPIPFAFHTSHLVQYYGTVQSVSTRSVIYDLLRRYKGPQGEVGVPQMYMPDGLHPWPLGHLVWADVMIYTIKQV